MGIVRSATRATNLELREDLDAAQAAIDAAAIRHVTVACSDEKSEISTGTKVKFRMVGAISISSIRCSVGTAQTSGPILTVDVNVNDSSILSTKITIDNNEKTSLTATTQPVISSSSVNDDDEISIDVDQVGTGASGLKVSIIWE